MPTTTWPPWLRRTPSFANDMGLALGDLAAVQRWIEMGDKGPGSRGGGKKPKGTGKKTTGTSTPTK